MRLLRASVLTAVVAASAGCGGDSAGERPVQPLGTGGLGRALDLARDGGRQPMRFRATITRPGRGTRPSYDADGHLDLRRRAGDATLRIADAEDVGLPAQMALKWTATTVTVAGQARSRSDARASGGLLGALPDVLHALAEIVADANAVRERAAGSWLFEVPPTAAIRSGIPPQAPARGRWKGEAQAAPNGRLRRVVLQVPAPALGATVRAGTSSLELELG